MLRRAGRCCATPRRSWRATTGTAPPQRRCARSRRPPVPDELARDRHRQLQRSRGARGVPAIARRAHRAVPDRRSSSWTTRRPTARRRWCGASGPRCSVIEAGGNLGFARANNVGIRATTSEFVLLLNPDTVVPPGAIATLCAAWRSHPDAAPRRARGLSTTRDFPSCRSGGPSARLASFGRRSSAACTLGASAGRARGRSLDARSRASANGSAAPACCAPRGSRGRRPARRALLHVHRGRRPVRLAPTARAGPSSSSRTPRSCTCAADPPVAIPNRAHAPKEPDRVLRETPSRLGAAAQQLSAVDRKVPMTGTGGQHARPQAPEITRTSPGVLGSIRQQASVCVLAAPRPGASQA